MIKVPVRGRAKAWIINRNLCLFYYLKKIVGRSLALAICLTITSLLTEKGGTI